MALDWQSLRKLGFWPGLFVHYVIAVVGSIVIGFVPELIVGPAYHDTAIEPYSPMILIVAGCLGYWFNKKLGHSAPRQIWVIGVAWLVYGTFEESTYWYNSPGYSSRIQYVLNNFFGHGNACSGSECLGEFFFTTPCAISIVYSVAAMFGLRLYKSGKVDESGFPLG